MDFNIPPPRAGLRSGTFHSSFFVAPRRLRRKQRGRATRQGVWRSPGMVEGSAATSKRRARM